MFPYESYQYWRTVWRNRLIGLIYEQALARTSEIETQNPLVQRRDGGDDVYLVGIGAHDLFDDRIRTLNIAAAQLPLDEATMAGVVEAASTNKQTREHTRNKAIGCTCKTSS